MSLIIPELKLTYLEGSNPKHYALNVKINGQLTHPNLIVNNDSGTWTIPNDHYVVNVELGGSSPGSDNIDIDLGQITFDSEESLVEVELKQNNTVVGKKSVRVKEAQQESRPIKEKF